MADLSRDVVRSILNIQGFDPPEPEFTEVFYRINALIEGLVQLDQLDVYHTETVAPSSPSEACLSVSTGTAASAQGNGTPHTDDIAFMTIREQASLIESKKLSPVELTRTYLERIEKYDPYLYAFNLVMADDAMAEAKQAEQEIAAGKLPGAPCTASRLVSRTSSISKAT